MNMRRLFLSLLILSLAGCAGAPHGSDQEGVYDVSSLESSDTLEAFRNNSSLTRASLPDPPIIDYPKHDSLNGRYVLLSGTGTAGARVLVVQSRYINNVLVDTLVNEQGQWSARSLLELPVGSFAISGRQTLDGRVSAWGATRGFTVVQPAPAPVIEIPSEGSQSGHFPLLSGTGIPGARVQVMKSREINTVLVDTHVDEHGQWSARSALELPAGSYAMAGRQTLDGKVSPWGLTRSFTVVGSVPAPIIETPVQDSPSGRFPLLSGKGIPGARVQVTKSRDASTVLVDTLVNKDGQWSARSALQLPAGGYAMAGRQTLDGKVSPWGLTRSFTVVDSVPAPTIAAPEQDIQTGRFPLLSGEGIPGARMQVMKSREINTVLVDTLVDARGQWSAISSLALPVGSYAMAGRQILDRKTSAWSTTRTFIVDDNSQGLLVAERLNARFADTRSACDGQRASYNCNGILIRITDASPDFHAWNPSPGSIQREGVPFSYIRADIRLVRLAWGKGQGLIMKELDAPSPYRLNVRCAFPYDGATFYRSASCNEHSGAPLVSKPCDQLGITTAAAWRDYFYNLASRFTGCSFRADQAQFDLSIRARNLLNGSDQDGQHNELIISSWPQNIPEQLPLEAFFYLHSTARTTGLAGAQLMQRDYANSTGGFMPIVRLNLQATDGKLFSYAAQDQAVK